MKGDLGIIKNYKDITLPTKAVKDYIALKSRKFL